MTLQINLNRFRESLARASGYAVTEVDGVWRCEDINVATPWLGPIDYVFIEGQLPMVKDR